MKTFVEIQNRLAVLGSSLDGDFWRDMLNEIKPPSKLPEEQKVLDMAFRDSKAFSGYIPDMMAVMRKHLPAELPASEVMALRGIFSYVQLITRILLLLLLVPRYNDHEDLIATFNGYRQTIVFIEDYLAQAESK